MATSFIGIDLSWKGASNNSGLASFSGDGNGADPASFGSGADDLDSVTEFILANQGDSTVVAIDAPLIIRNPAGQRACERLVSMRFGRAHASAHSSNLGLYPNAAGVALARRLQERGFRHCSPPGSSWHAEGHWFFEVYPHPAQVVLFERDRIISYKKGSLAVKKRGLRELQSEMVRRLLGPSALRSSPQLVDFLMRDLEADRGTALKHYEDALDAIFCSYLAFRFWRWGWERSELFGDFDAGYIVVPTV